MGTFLRVWRTQWAGLTQAQLAIAVGARCGGRYKVRKYTVAEWEKGQPPHSAAELEALLAVMQARRATLGEADDFRQAVFAACSSRHYPELFPDVNLAYEDDVDVLAFALHQREEAAPGSTSMVSLVALQHQLEQAVVGGAGLDDKGARARQQQTALAWVRSIVGRRHWREAERPAQAALVFGQNCELLTACFGPRGLPPDLSVLGQRSCQFYAGRQAVRGREREVRAQSSALFRVYQEAWETRDYPAAMHALYVAVCPCGLPAEEATHIYREGVRRVEAAPDVGMAAVYRHAALHSAAVPLGLPDRAEQHLMAAEPLRAGDAWDQLYWHTLTGEWARRRGDPAAAQPHYERVLELAQGLRDPGGVARAARALETLDRAPRR
jgi:hypothetical protein